jgi:hypothetical protein
MHSHFVNLLDSAVTKLNRKLSLTSTRPYFEARLQKAISVKTLYNTGADISSSAAKLSMHFPLTYNQGSSQGQAPPAKGPTAKTCTPWGCTS